jgi:hypothetical protein
MLVAMLNPLILDSHPWPWCVWVCVYQQGDAAIKEMADKVRR